MQNQRQILCRRTFGIIKLAAIAGFLWLLVGSVVEGGAVALADDLTIMQNGRLNLYTSVQSDAVNTLNLTQHGQVNLGSASQYGVTNTATSHQKGQANGYGVGQFGLSNYSEAYQHSTQNNAYVLQKTAIVSGTNSGNGSALHFTQSSTDADALSRMQYTDHGITTFATIYHTGGVNILSVTPFAPSYGVMGRGH